MIRVLIVDDQAIVAEGLKVILNASPNIEVVGIAEDGAQAVERAAQLKPHLVLMDLKMPVLNGVQATRLIREQHPDIPVLILTTYDDDEWVIDAIRGGAAGYLLKDSGRDDIVAAIEGTMAGRTHIDPAVAAKLFTFIQYGAPPSRELTEELSERERKILRLLASGMTNAAIADHLSLAEGTVRNHITTIFEKLGVTDRAQATALAWRYGLVRPDDAG